MRILKTKIANSQKLHQERTQQMKSKHQKAHTSLVPLIVASQESQVQPKKRRRIPGSPVSTEMDRATKNIVKNYGKAICSFTCSNLAIPYLSSIIQKHNVVLNEFIQFVLKAKDGIESMGSFRNMLLVKEDEDEKISNFKKVFAFMCEVFIKYFSVNWIFSGRITYKEIYLKFRFKMLRRIKNPESFTYLSNRSKKEIL